MTTCETSANQETIPYYLGFRIIISEAMRSLIYYGYNKMDIQPSCIVALKQAAALIDLSGTDTDVELGICKKTNEDIISDARQALRLPNTAQHEIADQLCQTSDTLLMIANGEIVEDLRVNAADVVLCAMRAMAAEQRMVSTDRVLPCIR